MTDKSCVVEVVVVEVVVVVVIVTAITALLLESSCGIFTLG